MICWGFETSAVIECCKNGTCSREDEFWIVFGPVPSALNSEAFSHLRTL
jgi:hypothetical protein